jgi:hypothetical protein
VIRERRRLRRFMSSGAHECVALREAERALVESARWEHRSTALWLHFGALTYSIAMGVLLSVAFDRPLEGHRQLAIGGVVGQAMIITTPKVTLDGLHRYRRGVLSPLSSIHSFPMPVPGGAGVGIAGAF